MVVLVPDIMIVDQSAICRELLGRVLELQGYSAVWMPPDETPLDLSRWKPRLMILDPGSDGSPGWRLLKNIHRFSPPKSLPIIIVTDQSAKEDVLRAAKLGVRDYMLKSRFSLGELLVRVQRYARVVPPASPAEPENRVAAASASASSETGGPSLKPRGVEPADGSASRLPRDPATAVQTSCANSKDNYQESIRILSEMAKASGMTSLTRDDTLVKLDSAPVKTLPGVVAELISLINSPRGTVGDVALILRRDPVMTARVLRVANSAGFATQRARVANVEDAVKNIGVSGVRNLVVNVGVFDAFSGDGQAGLRTARVWQHGLGVAMLMEKLAPKDSAVPVGSAYLVGLCHDLADIVLRQHFATHYGMVESLMSKSGCSLRTVEGFVFGLPYADLVSHLLAKLGLPALITAPIAEFFERGATKGDSGSGSLLARALRALNVYAHGLMLAPGTAESLTPLTKTESDNTFGDVSLSTLDGELLRNEALATASILAGLDSSQTQQMGELLVPKRPIRIAYSRHASYSTLDPMVPFLHLAAREVSMLSSLKAVVPESLADVDGLIVAGPRNGAAEVLAQDLDHIARLLAGKAVSVLYLCGCDAPSNPTKPPAAEIHKLPITIEHLGQFLGSIRDRHG